MRAALLPLLLVACQSVPSKPPHRQTAVFGCEQSPDPVSGFRYACSSYELTDSTGGAGLQAMRLDYVQVGMANGFSPRSRAIDVEGADAAVLIEYRSGVHEAIDVIAAKPADPYVRLVQCRVSFEAMRNRKAQEALCKRTITALLERPAPPPHHYPEACLRAREHLATLPGHPEEADIRDAQQILLAGCTERIAACVFASRSYIEATMCRD